jgi:hypothetical protein
MNQPQKKLLKIYKYAYKLKADGKTISEIKRELLLQNLDEKSADAVIENIDRHYIERKKKVRRDSFVYGTIWCTAGAIAGFKIYVSPRANIVPYVLTFSAIAFGIILVCKGLLQKTK